MWRCRHCPAPLSRPRGAARGLCWACYRDPAVKAAHGRRKPGPKSAGEGADEPAAEDREPTAAELDATIAEQMRCLPAWWDDETERERAIEYARKVYVLVKCA